MPQKKPETHFNCGLWQIPVRNTHKAQGSGLRGTRFAATNQAKVCWLESGGGGGGASRLLNVSMLPQVRDHLSPFGEECFVSRDTLFH